jgi:hypothetical protein
VSIRWVVCSLVWCHILTASDPAGWRSSTRISRAEGSSVAVDSLRTGFHQTVQTAKRKASAEFTPSAPNGLPLRHVKSAALLGRQDKTRRLDKVEDVEDSPRIKRMRVDRSAAANERNGGEIA